MILHSVDCILLPWPCVSGNREDIWSQSRVLLADCGNSRVCLWGERDHTRTAHRGEHVVLQKSILLTPFFLDLFSPLLLLNQGPSDKCGAPDYLSQFLSFPVVGISRSVLQSFLPKSPQNTQHPPACSRLRTRCVWSAAPLSTTGVPDWQCW